MIDRLPDLELFTRIVEAGSLSAAARALGMTQPTVSKRLAAMERALSVRLIQRSTHHITLTEEGQRWYDACRRWLGEFKDVTAELSGQARGVVGTLRVNAPVTFGRLVLAPLVLRYLAAQPQVRVNLTLDDRRVDLVEDNVDVAVRIGAIANPQVVARPLVTYRTQLAASPAYLAKEGAPQTVQELLSRNVFLYGTDAQEDIEGPTGRARVHADPRLRTNDSAAYLTALRAGLGLGITSPWLLEAPFADGSLVPVLPGAHGRTHRVHAIYLPSRVLPARVKSFVSFLQRELPRAVAHLPGVSL